MANRKWTNQRIDAALQQLAACYELPPDRSAALEARIRREVIARYGRFDVPMRAAVHTSEPARGGMIVFLRGMRPALAFAVLGVLIVGGVVAMRRLRDVRSIPSVEPAGSSVSVVAVAEPVVPGSGVSVSVFGAPVESRESRVESTLKVIPAARRTSGRRLNPAAGVFSQWGESVFSEEERLRNERVGKNVFPNS